MYVVSLTIKRAGRALTLAAVWTGHITAALARRLEAELKAITRAGAPSYPYYRHTLPVRIMHWTNVLSIGILLMSGLNILSAHPALYWGASSYRGVPPILEILGDVDNKGDIVGITRIFGHDFHTTGFIGASKGPMGQLVIREFPSWLIIPDSLWLAMARRWHFFFAWLFVLNGIAFVTYSILSRHLGRDLVPTRSDLRATGTVILDGATNARAVRLKVNVVASWSASSNYRLVAYFRPNGEISWGPTNADPSPAVGTGASGTYLQAVGTVEVPIPADNTIQYYIEVSTSANLASTWLYVTQIGLVF